MNIKVKKLPEKLTETDLIRGECDIPSPVIEFYSTLLAGKSHRRRRSIHLKRTVESLSSDVIFAVSNGKIKPSKHISLGITIKSLTNSKKIVHLLNRSGHCCSYTILEGLETEATFTACLRSEICPEDIIQEKNLCTGLAFDNFDRFVDTDTGKDTLHDTVGIIFQNIVDYGPIEQGTVVEENIGNDNRECPITGSKRRRTFDVVMHELEPYLKTPRLIQILQPLESPSRLIVPSDLKSLVHIDFIWMLSHCFKVVNTPMWVGFNSLIYDDTSAKQKISYLTTINSSPQISRS